MPPDTIRAAIYTRISQDRSGDELGVERQQRLCADLVEARGWKVTDTYQDDDISAFKRRKRPGFERLKADIRDGHVDVVVAVDQDRIARRLSELVEFIELLETHRIPIVTTAGDLDSTTADGILRIHIIGAVAENESRKKSERMRRQREQAAISGTPHGGPRPFGYLPGGVAVHPEEAALIREAVRRILAGETVTKIAREWEQRGITAPGGKPWNHSPLRRMLVSPRLAGLRQHKGEVVGPAKWPAIISRADHERLVALVESRGYKRPGRRASYLLSTLMVCGRCGGKMYHTVANGQGRYKCQETPGSGSCGRVSIQAGPVERDVADAVLQRLEAASLTDEPEQIGNEETEVESQLRDLAEMFGAGEITRAEWIAARKGLEDRLHRAQKVREKESRVALLAPFRTPGSLRAAWPDLDPDLQRAIIAAVVAKVTVAPTRPGRAPDPITRLRVEWIA